MKNSKDNMQNDLDNVEDLTLFANESFDTDDVDLFEFTGDSNSPLTRLKSIILSLDWEISDDILQELVEEINNLQQLWRDDKVAQVYLQGLHKIGSYLRAEGAYSHPNAIKLLLSFFYNFEKIISSETITGNAISSMLKADVRKFKILQYQINQKTLISDIATEENGKEELATAGEEQEKSSPECEPLTCLKATILGLEWEVTDKGLNQFNSQIAEIREHFLNDKSAQVLIQGLQALGGYITDERADAHPEAFTMLHSFYEGLEVLLDEKNLDQKEKQNILIDRVNRLNVLKAIIAEEKKNAGETETEESIDEILAPIIPDSSKTSPETVESLTDVEVPEEANVDDLLDPAAITPVEDKIADDFIEQELLVGGAIAGAAAIAESEDEIDLLEDARENEFDEELDLFFSEEEENIFQTAEAEKTDKSEGDFEDLELDFAEEEFDLDLSDGEIQPESDSPVPQTEKIDEEFEQLFVEEDESGLQPALAEAEEEGGFNEDEIASTLPDVPSDEIDDKLDAFFGFDEEEEEEEEEKTQEPALQDAAEEDTAIAPALADAAEEGGFNEDEAVATLSEEPTAEIEDKLDAFFGLDEEEEENPAPALQDAAEEDSSIAPALADAAEEGGFNEDEAVATLSEEPTAEIEDKLDAFFGLDEEEEENPAPALQDADEEDNAIAPALADAAEEGGFNEDEAVATLSAEPTAEIEDKLDAFFSLDEEIPGPTIPDETAANDNISPEGGLLATLGIGLTALAAKSSIDKIRESKDLAHRLKDEATTTPEQKILLQLLESTLTLLPGEDNNADSNRITELSRSLHQQLEKQQLDSLSLCGALSRTIAVLADEIVELRTKIK